MRYSNEYGSWELTSMPGCTQTVISHSVFIFPKYRNKGYGQKNLHERIAQCKDLGYNYMICSVATKNEAQIHILKKENFTMLDSFLSSKTNNNVAFYGRIL